MTSERFARTTLQAVSPGMDALSALFSDAARARAAALVATGSVQIREDDGGKLLAAVSGTTGYLTGFRRVGTTLFYGCTCPFFTEEQLACKHLWALVRAAPASSLVLHAAECTAFRANVECLYGEPADPGAGEAEEAAELAGSLTAQLARSLLACRR